MTKTNKTKNTTQYVLDTIIHKTHDEDKNKPKTTEHNMCCTPSYTRQKTETNTHKTQHKICRTQLCANTQIRSKSRQGKSGMEDTVIA